MTENLKNYIDALIHHELERLKKEPDPFLRTGEMGLALFLFGMYDFTGEESYKCIANKLLDSISSHIPPKSPLEIYEGVTGIGLAIMFCHHRGYIYEDIDEVLSDIDDYLYKNAIKAVEKYSDRYLGTYLDILLYLSYRLDYTTDQDLKLIFSNLWLTIFNKVSLSITYESFIEPNPADLKFNLAEFLYVCALGISLGDFHKNRILKVLDDLQYFIFSYKPVLQFNRLTLVLALHHLTQAIGTANQWHAYKESLIKSISFDYIVEEELLPNDIFMTHGVPCLYMLLHLHGYPISSRQIQLIIDKIGKSNLTNKDYLQMINRGFTGLNGVLGTMYTLLHIKNNKDE